MALQRLVDRCCMSRRAVRRLAVADRRSGGQRLPSACALMRRRRLEASLIVAALNCRAWQVIAAAVVTSPASNQTVCLVLFICQSLPLKAVVTDDEPDRYGADAAWGEPNQSQLFPNLAPRIAASLSSFRQLHDTAMPRPAAIAIEEVALRRQLRGDRLVWRGHHAPVTAGTDRSNRALWHLQITGSAAGASGCHICGALHRATCYWLRAPPRLDGSIRQTTNPRARSARLSPRSRLTLRLSASSLAYPEHLDDTTQRLTDWHAQMPLGADRSASSRGGTTWISTTAQAVQLKAPGAQGSRRRRARRRSTPVLDVESFTATAAAPTSPPVMPSKSFDAAPARSRSKARPDDTCNGQLSKRPPISPSDRRGQGVQRASGL